MLSLHRNHLNELFEIQITPAFSDVVDITALQHLWKQNVRVQYGEQSFSEQKPLDNVYVRGRLLWQLLEK